MVRLIRFSILDFQGVTLCTSSLWCCYILAKILKGTHSTCADFFGLHAGRSLELSVLRVDASFMVYTELMCGVRVWGSRFSKIGRRASRLFLEALHRGLAPTSGRQSAAFGGVWQPIALSDTSVALWLAQVHRALPSMAPHSMLPSGAVSVVA